MEKPIDPTVGRIVRVFEPADEKRDEKPLSFSRMPTSPEALMRAIRKMDIPHLEEQAKRVDYLFRTNAITKEEMDARLASLYRTARRALSNG